MTTATVTIEGQVLLRFDGKWREQILKATLGYSSKPVPGCALVGLFQKQDTDEEFDEQGAD